MAAAKNSFQKLHDLAAQFVTKQKGKWEHDEWESFQDKASKLGFESSDEMKRQLGNLLEASKFFYHSMPVKAAPKKKTAPAKKAATVKKAPAKSAKP